jgi:hypothetical protein
MQLLAGSRINAITTLSGSRKMCAMDNDRVLRRGPQWLISGRLFRARDSALIGSISPGASGL